MVIVLSQCDHVLKVVTWGTVLEGRRAILRPSKWGCLSCDLTWDEMPSEFSSVASGPTVAHESSCECFACRAKTLKIAYCGIGGGDATTQKKWDRNLDAYRAAKAQGIQPKSTRASAIEAAVRQSDKTGTAFVAS